MRSFLLAALLVALGAAPAAADYRRLPGPPPDDDLVIANGVVIVGAGSSLTFHLPGGGVRTLPIAGGSRLVEEVDVSGSAAAILAIKGGGSSRGFYGPLTGPFERLSGGWIDVAVSGSRVIALYRRGEDRGELRIVDVRTGARRTLRVSERGPRVIAASGRYVAYATDRDGIVVRSLASGRKVYRVHAEGYYRLGPHGRVVTLGDGVVKVATPAHPRLRTLRRIGLGSDDFAVRRQGIAVARGDRRASTEVALLGWDGRVRPLTPLLPGVGAIAYEGRTVAFAVGACVFAGPVPAPGAPLPPVPTEGCLRSTDGGAGR